MFGQLQYVMNGPFDALNAENSTLIGVGITMEGIF